LSDCVDIAVSGLTLKARTDLGTTWGRGIAILGTCSDIAVNGFTIDTVKQSGILFSDGQPTRVVISNGHIRNCGVNSGYGLEVVNCKDCSVEGVVFEDMAASDCVYLEDWENLVFKNCRMTQRRAGVYCRGIHLHEASVSGIPSRNRLDISNCTIQMFGVNCAQPIYLRFPWPGYNYSSTTSAPPSAGEIRLNNATPSAATSIYVMKVDKWTQDMHTWFSGLTTGNCIWIRKDAGWAANYWQFTLTGPVVDNSTYYTIPVTYTSGVGTIVNADGCVVAPVQPIQNLFITGCNCEWNQAQAGIVTDYINTGKICNNCLINANAPYDYGNSVSLTSTNNN
jgi:hypothetical protein